MIYVNTFFELVDDESRRLFEEIYLKYRKQMFLVACSVLNNNDDAEDVIHDVFLKIAEKHMVKITSIENNTDLRNYLLKATRNTALDHLRKQCRECLCTNAEIELDIPEMVDISNAAFIEKICSEMEYNRIVSTILSLQEIYAEVLHYYFVMELSVPEVAKLLDCKESTIKQRLVRGKKLLYLKLFKKEQK